MSDIRTAILAAADVIEARPELFEFMECGIPDRTAKCGSPGCALGWITAFSFTAAEARKHSVIYPFTASLPLMGLDPMHGDGVFYERMSELCTSDYEDAWQDDAEVCAKTMRLYANKYHPAATKRSDAELVAELMDRVAAEVAAACRTPESVETT